MTGLGPGAGASGPLWDALLDEAALLETGLDETGLVHAEPSVRPRPSVAADPGDQVDVLSSFGRARPAAVGAVLVPDRSLAAVHRAWSAGPEHEDDLALPVCLVNTGGAGGLLALTRRELAGLDVRSVWSDLRDLGDLAGNVARVVAAAEELSRATGHDPVVRIGVPDAPGWEAAVEEVEAAGLEAGLRVDAETPGVRLAARLAVLVEADCGFALRDAAPPGPQRLAGLIQLVRALVDDGDPDRAASRLDRTGPDDLASVLALDEVEQQRVRRRLRSLAVTGARRLADGLVAAEPG